MQDLIKNMHSKRFLLIYLAVVAFLLLIYLNGQDFDSPTAPSIPQSGAYQLAEPQPLPNFLLQDAQQQMVTNADLQGRWTFVYFYDAGCEPDCPAIWQVLSNLADRHAGQQLLIWIIDASDNQQLLAAPPVLPGNIKLLFDPQGERPLWQFFANASGADQDLLAALFLIDPKGQWQAGFRAPFTSSQLQQAYLKMRAAYAKAP